MTQTRIAWLLGTILTLSVVASTPALATKKDIGVPAAQRYKVTQIADRDVVLAGAPGRMVGRSIRLALPENGRVVVVPNPDAQRRFVVPNPAVERRFVIPNPDAQRRFVIPNPDTQRRFVMPNPDGQ